jgi:hypothetical protein
MSRGTIMSLESKSAIVLTPGGEFVRLRRLPGYEIGTEIAYSVRQNAVKLRRFLQAGISAAVLLFVFVGFWLVQPPTVVAYVTMDINPSVEIGLDAKMNVRELRAVNSDAEAIVAGVKYKGQDLDTVMQALAVKLVTSHILIQPDGEIVIASVPVKSIAAEWETQVTEKVKGALSEAAKQDDSHADGTLVVTTISVPQEVRKVANEQGVSSGKMAFWLAAESQGYDVPIETLKNQSLKKIAAEWGGVNKVLSSEDDPKADKEVWKELLKEAKANQKLPSAPKASNTPESSAAPTDDSPSAKNGDMSKDDKGNNNDNSKDNNNDNSKDDVQKDVKNSVDDKQNNDDNQNNDDKQNNGEKQNNGVKQNSDNKQNIVDDKQNNSDKKYNDDKSKNVDKLTNDGKSNDDKQNNDDKKNNSEKVKNDNKSTNGGSDGVHDDS